MPTTTNDFTVAQYADLKWSVKNFRPLQRYVIDASNAGRDVLAVMPTGSGKSLCYQLPAIMDRDRLTVVICPLKALMRDQVADLNKRDIAAEYINGDLYPNDADAILRNAMTGRLRLLYVSPERCMDPGFMHHLQRCNIARFVIDEAHCISQWGHDFRPAYKRLGDLRVLFPGVPIGCFTATARLQVQDEIAKTMGLRNHSIYVGDCDRPNLRLEVRRRPTDPNSRNNSIDASDKAVLETLRSLITHWQDGGIIYCPTRYDTVRIAQMLHDNDEPARSYHGEMSDVERRATQDWFMNTEGAIAVATIAFGMGINKPNVRFVIHSFMPSAIETYHQEIGRAGRDGDPATCVILYDPSDLDVWMDRFSGEDMDAVRFEALAGSAGQMADYCDDGGCRHQWIRSYFDQVEPDTAGQCIDNACDNCATVNVGEKYV